MNTYGLVVIIVLAVSSGYAQNNGNTYFGLCKLLNSLLTNCLKRHQTCPQLIPFMTIFKCKTDADTTTDQPTTTRTTRSPTTKPPFVADVCGISNSGNPQVFLNVGSKIVGGKAAPRGFLPWNVKVRRGSAHCTGVILNKDTILTAAHCVTRYENRPASIRIGHGSTNSDSAKYITASKIVVHPDYRRNGNPDFAIIKLSRTITFTRNSKPICLPHANQKIIANKRSLVSGWGIKSESSNRIPKDLQYVMVPIVSQDLCNKYYSNGISPDEVCAGYNQGGRDSCQGDSGGPLIMPTPDGQRWEVIGIVSRGKGCARPKFPGIYARVAADIPWIKSLM